MATNSKYTDHDEMVQSIISYLPDRTKVDTEVFYNNYGERGYVDLYWEELAGNAVEIKAQPKQANKVIKQFKRQVNNFEPGSNYPQESQFESIVHHLVFTASKGNKEHLLENIEHYKTVLTGNITISIVSKDNEHVNLTETDTKSSFKEKVENRLDLTDFSKNDLNCPYCGKTYKRETYFKEHVQTCNEDQTVTKISGVEA